MAIVNTPNMPQWKKEGYPTYQSWLAAQYGTKANVPTTVKAPTNNPLSNYSEKASGVVGADSKTTGTVGQYAKPDTNTPAPVPVQPAAPTLTGSGKQNPVAPIEQPDQIAGIPDAATTGKHVSTLLPEEKASSDEGVIQTPNAIQGVPNTQESIKNTASASAATNLLKNYFMDNVGNNTDNAGAQSEYEKTLSDRQRYWDEQRKLIEENYKNYEDSLEADKRISQQNASISLDKLMKYLPEEVKAQGLNGLGISATVAQKANNDYMTQMSAINKDYNANKLNLYTEKNNALGELERYRVNDLDDIKAAEDARLTAAQEDTYNYARNLLANGAVSSPEELNSFVNHIKDAVSDIQYQNLIAFGTTMLNSQSNAQKQTESDLIKDNIAVEFNTLFDSGDYETASKFLEANKGSLDEWEYNLYKTKLSSSGYVSEEEVAAVKNDLQNYITQGDTDKAEAALGALNGYLTEEETANYQNQISIQQVKDSIKGSKLTWNNDGSMGANPSEWTTLSIKGKDVYRVKYGSQVTDETLLNATSSFEDNSVFGYDGKVYVKRKGKTYEVEARPGWQKQYDNLYNEIFG